MFGQILKTEPTKNVFHFCGHFAYKDKSSARLSIRKKNYNYQKKRDKNSSVLEFAQMDMKNIYQILIC